MKTVPAWVRSMFLVALGSMIAIPDVNAAGGKGRKWGGGGTSSAARSATHSRSNAQGWNNSTQRQRSNTAASSTASGQVNSPYGYGTSRGRSNGYAQRGRSYRGSSYGNRYATSNQNIRSIVTQLRNTHATLARLNSDYQGHRSRDAFHQPGRPASHAQPDGFVRDEHLERHGHAE